MVLSINLKQTREKDLEHILRAYAAGIDSMNNRMNVHDQGKTRNVAADRNAIRKEFAHLREISKRNGVDKITLQKIDYIESLTYARLDGRINALAFMIRMEPLLNEARVPFAMYNSIISEVRLRNRAGL